MSTPYIGEIRMFSFGSRGAPEGWLACDGSLLSIAQYDVLFALIGTTYGGDGVTTFAAPDLRGRVPVHQVSAPGFSTYVLGQRAGTETVALSANQMPAHTHTMVVTSAAATAVTPSPALLPGAVSGENFYASDIALASQVPMSVQSTSLAGGGQPHENCMPTLTVQFCIAWAGIFPTQA